MPRSPLLHLALSLSAALVTVFVGASCSRAPLLDGPGSRPAGEGGAAGDAPRCGDGVVDPDERCDDGNDDPGDGCDSSCQRTTCGNGVVDRGEECDEGPGNADAPALRIEHGDLRLAVMPVTDQPDLVGFYDYFSKSAHTGFESVGTSRILLYYGKQTQLLGLVAVHGIDLDTSGISQPESTVDMFLEGVPESAVITIIDDDPDEFFSGGPGVVVGQWWFANNSDGGALDLLPFPGNWAISVDVTLDGGVDTWAFVDGHGYAGDGDDTALAPSETLLIISDDTPSTCRMDCTAPRCGDGILDAGEVCDDRAAGSCSEDCQWVL